jgi:hypothetical protein
MTLNFPKIVFSNRNKLKFGELDYLAFFILVLFSLSGCNVEPELADVKIKNSEPRLVVEGLVTDLEGPYEVKVSLSGNFDNKTISKINDAVVIISDNLGNADTLENVREGVYQTSSIKGKVGNTYNLSVYHNGAIYTASAYLSGGLDIDSLSYIFMEESLIYEEGYYLTLFGRENPDEANYRWYIYENDTADRGITIEDDQLYNQNVNNLLIERKFDPGDSAKIEVHSLSKSDYIYYLGLQNVLNNDGGFFSAPPKNPQGNISNGALGLFRASKVSSSKILISE